MTALLFYYFMFLIPALYVSLLLLRFLDIVLQWVVDLIPFRKRYDK